MARPDFSNVWGSTNAPFTAITDTDYKAGWVFRTGAPPRRVNFDYFQNLSDLRHEWLGEQMLLAVGHEWQSDVTYNLEAYTRSTVNGKLYKSLDAVNLGNEPSATPLKWREVPDLSVGASTTGTPGAFSNLKGSATGLSAVVTITASAVSVLNASNESKVLTGVSVTPSLAVSGVNGLDTGTSAANTWYYTYIIWNGTTTAGLISLSSTAPTMPSGYTHKCRVNSFRSDSTGNKFPLSFVQYGNDYQFVVAPGTNVASGRVMANGTAGNVNTPTYVSVATGAFVPPTASMIAVNVSAQSSLEALVAPNASYGGKFSQTNPAFYGSGNGGGNASNIRMVLETTNIHWASTGAALICTGYKENR